MDSDPDWYVDSVVDSYPPSIAVLDPLTFDCVVSANTEVVSNSNIKIIKDKYGDYTK